MLRNKEISPGWRQHSESVLLSYEKVNKIKMHARRSLCKCYAFNFSNPIQLNVITFQNSSQNIYILCFLWKMLVMFASVKPTYTMPGCCGWLPGSSMWLLRHSECPLMHREMLNVFSFFFFFFTKNIKYMSYLWQKVNVCVLEVILAGIFHLVGSSEVN